MPEGCVVRRRYVRRSVIHFFLQSVDGDGGRLPHNAGKRETRGLLDGGGHRENESGNENGNVRERGNGILRLGECVVQLESTLFGSKQEEALQVVL